MISIVLANNVLVCILYLKPKFHIISALIGMCLCVWDVLRQVTTLAVLQAQNVENVSVVIIGNLDEHRHG